MSVKSLIMDEGRTDDGGGGGPPDGGSNVVVGNGASVVNGGGSATSYVAVTSPTFQRTSPQQQQQRVILRNFRGHRGGRHSLGQGNKKFSQSRKLTSPHNTNSGRRAVSSSEAENQGGVVNQQPTNQESPRGAANQQSANQESGNQQSTVHSHSGGSPPSGPRRRIRRDKGKWKPYHTLSWEEKKERDALETQRAEEKRKELTHLGYPQAPYNTTQFLMADHRGEYGSEGLDIPSSDESSTAEEDASMDRGYDQEWSRVLSEHLNSLSKSQLISQCLAAEQEKTKLEQRVRSLEREVSDLTPRLDENSSDDAKEKEVFVETESLID